MDGLVAMSVCPPSLPFSFLILSCWAVTYTTTTTTTLPLFLLYTSGNSLFSADVTRAMGTEVGQKGGSGRIEEEEEEEEES